MERKKTNLDTIKEFVQEKHGDKYDFSKFVYTGYCKKGVVICPIHGEFEMTPSALLHGQGCPKCAGRNRTRDELIEEFRVVHGDTYSYDRFVFTRMKDKSYITCKKHGDFLQSPEKHLTGRGCPKCAVDRRKNAQICTQDEFIRHGVKIHGDKDDLSNVVYSSMDDKVEIVCKKHGPYSIRPYDYLQGHRCPKCGFLMSNAEDEICRFLTENGIDEKDILKNDRVILDGKEIDIYLPKLKIGIEYNGLKWHSEEFGKGRYYHLEKLKMANSKVVKLIQVFEDEYKEHKDVVLSKIAHLIGVNNNLPKIMARKCNIMEIDKKMSKEFLDKNHIQGYGRCTLSFGCFYNEELVGVMSFTNKGDDIWELTRFATSIKYVCQGVGGKLFKHFIKEYKPLTVKTFADRRWTLDANDNFYKKLGFEVESILKPDYRYVYGKDPHIRIHKFNMRKRLLNKKYGLSLKLTESEMTKKLGYYKIWDCGLIKYIWKAYL